MAKKKSRSKAVPKKKKKKKKTKAKSAARARSRAVKKRKAPARAKAATQKKAARPAAPRARITTLPDLEVTTTSGRLRLSDLKGKNVVLYFYPKDDTPGCTTEGCDIRDRYGEFQRTDTVVLGVSRDSIASHERFKAKFGFPFELVSDPDETLCRAFDVMREKSLYGRKYIGVDRSTFLFDKTGALRKEYRSVKVDGHADEILREINGFQ